MKINYRNKEELIKFLEEHKYHTTSEKCSILGIAPSTLNRWMNEFKETKKYCKQKSPIFNKSDRKKKKIEKCTLPRDKWDNKEWLEKAYKRIGGVKSLAEHVGVTRDHMRYLFKKYKIKTVPYEEASKSKNPNCSKDWLMYHYATRKEYIKWYKKNDTEFDEHGGLGYGILKCAELAGVKSFMTITKWLIKFDIPIRDKYESGLGELNPRFKKTRNGNPYSTIEARNRQAEKDRIS